MSVRLMRPRLFPIMNGPAIPWSVIAPFEYQAQRNHGQSLECLAARGGLSPAEAIDILNGQRWDTCPLRGAAAVLALMTLANQRSELDNHHSALSCPHCNPDGRVLCPDPTAHNGKDVR